MIQSQSPEEVFFVLQKIQVTIVLFLDLKPLCNCPIASANISTIPQHSSTPLEAYDIQIVISLSKTIIQLSDSVIAKIQIEISNSYIINCTN